MPIPAIITTDRTTLRSLPDLPGVYLFYGTQDELLYVGKSVSLRSRVRAHFNEPSERRMMRQVRRIEARTTAGELGALLLESQMIKELKPLFNKAQRQRRRLVIARRVDNEGGYATVRLEAIDHLAFDPAEPILGLFKHFTQAREFMAGAAREYRLCPKLLRLEQSRSCCFAYHLHQCDGACIGEEAPEPYNARVERAFEERRIRSWPHAGALAVEEASGDGTLRELFIVDNWCLLGSTVTREGTDIEHIRGSRRFDFDAYKILYAFLSAPPPTVTVRGEIPPIANGAAPQRTKTRRSRTKK